MPPNPQLPSPVESASPQKDAQPEAPATTVGKDIGTEAEDGVNGSPQDMRDASEQVAEGSAAPLVDVGDGDKSEEITQSAVERKDADKEASRTTKDGAEEVNASTTAEDSLVKKTAGLKIEVPPPPGEFSATRPRDDSLPPPPPPPKDEKYKSPAKSPMLSPSMDEKQAERIAVSSDTEAMEYDAKSPTAEQDNGQGEKGADDSKSEIQSIMGQFDEGREGPGMDEIMSPRLEKAGPMLGSPVIHPPRRSSLEPLNVSNLPSPIADRASVHNQPLQSPPPRSSSLQRASFGASMSRQASAEPPSTPPKPLPRAAPPQPDPEPDLPFDFHRFLEQLRHRTADPVAKFLRSFLLEFGKKQWMVHEQVKIISDFLEFITKKMAQCDVWRTVSDAEFDNAREGMEKLVMNRLYSQTFSPAIPAPEPAQSKGRRRQAPASPQHVVRRGQHQEDVERDEVLAQKVRIYGWVREEHLDIKAVGDKGRKFLTLAQQELIKIKSYRAPRDKVICILNCCKVIFGFLRNANSDQSADSFVPLLIWTVLQANPEHLVSNVQYILRFRNQEKLGGEAGYYISSLMGAVQFIENLDRTNLTISDEDFEKNVEAAVSAIAEKHTAEEAEQQVRQHRRQPSPSIMLSEKSTISRPEVTPRNSLEAERASPRRSTSLRNRPNTEAESSEDNAAVAGLLRTIQRPLSTIGRIFSDDNSPTQSQQQQQQQHQSSHPALTPQPGSTPRLSPNPPPSPRRSTDMPGRTSREQQGAHTEQQQRGSSEQQKQQLSAADAAARQASAEAEEARRIQRKEHQTVVETLSGMFPDLDREVIDDVVRMKEGRVGLAVDACLALSN